MGVRRLLSAAFVIIACVLALVFRGGNDRPNILKIGIPEEPKTLNIWLASDANSKKILSQIYQSLYIRDPETFELIPWLASHAPEFDPQSLSYTVRLRPVKWSDGSDLTSADVAFTGRLIKKLRIPRYISKWKFITKIETPDARTVRFYLESPKAVFLTRTLTTPIVPEKQWAGVAEAAGKKEKPLTTLLNHKIETPVGCGPFVLSDRRRGAYIFMKRNEYFFGRGRTINGHRLGPHVDGIIYKIYGTADVAILALKKASIDMFWWGIQPGYMEDLKQEDRIRVYVSEKSALYFMGFNLRKPPFDDPVLRRAIAVLIDKDFIISRILQGYGIRMRSIIPPGNRFWYCSDVARHGELMTREYRVKTAWEILRSAGYSWEVPPVDSNGNIVPAEGFRLPDGTPMERFTILTPPADYDPHRAMSGMMIQEWLREMGMPAFSRPMAFGSLLDRVKSRHEFDTFILGYGKLSLDPAYIGNFFHSGNDKPRGWNMSGYRNPEFDRIAESARSAMDQNQRRHLVWKMQKMIMDDVPYIPLYNPALIEAVRTDRFDGWVKTLGGVGNIWSFCRVRTIGNEPSAYSKSHSNSTLLSSADNG